MESNYLRIAQLIERFLSDTITAEEQQELQQFEISYPQIGVWLENKEFRRDEIHALLHAYMQEDIQLKWDSTRTKARLHRKKQRTRRLLVAASLVAVLCLGTWTAFHFSGDGKLTTVALKNKTVVPGKQQAILTLSNGEVILLAGNDSTTIREGGNLMKIADNQLDYATTSKDEVHLHKLSVPIGGTYRIQLNDGTIVWLNADSEVEYPSVFTGDERRVRIKGEAFFEVAKDPDKPFRVQVGESTVEAVGTAFNINTHLKEGQIKTILTEGRIKVSVADKSVLIDKGNATLVESRQITVAKADPEEAVAWKEGYFYFGGKDLRSIMSEIARWYDIEVDYQRPLSDEKYQGGIKRTESIQAVCAVLKGLTGLDIQIKNRTLTIK
ncbi:MAG: FecR domain-containing protein [Sphingobacterium sp.]|jgi:ferric-dicitrate binding protein FerR (iron transport regulator)|uniref:FecR family protein n=1 Tax=Sphingobacterium sp. TaxID=341027 RepID=UPI0028395B74|nr:FecR domain-containing protein [Sphingobacterium sp.]MDR0264502.1 FecR domain-containing protein [Sphingobacterium sp.]